VGDLTKAAGIKTPAAFSDEVHVLFFVSGWAPVADRFFPTCFLAITVAGLPDQSYRRKE